MNYAIDLFTITQGSDNTFTFTIKETGFTTPIVIYPTDTFSARLVLLSDNSAALTKDLTVVHAGAGKVELLITAAETNGLVSGRSSSSADRYYVRPTYKLIIDCVTVVNGNFIAKVPEVYVD